MKPKIAALKFLFVLSFISFVLYSCQKDTARRVGGGSGTEPQVFSDIQYGSNTGFSGGNVSLSLDVYAPAEAAAGKTYPFILFVHGGGFVAGDKANAASFLKRFAEQGYVAASINYRIDSSLDEITDPCLIDSTVTQRGVYMAVQDTRAAMRFLVANATKYYIDTSRIFFNGNSAGAITMLNAYFLTQSDFNTRMPDIVAELGGIDNADNSFTNTFRIIGMAANSGCLPDPQEITSSNAIPIIFFHGGKDSVIPIDKGHAQYCPNSVYVYGSKSLYARMVQLGVPAVLHVDPEGEHGPYTDDFLFNNELCFFNSVLNKKPQSGSYTGQQSSCQ